MYKALHGDPENNGNQFATMPDGKTGIAVWEKPVSVLSYELLQFTGALNDSCRTQSLGFLFSKMNLSGIQLTKQLVFNLLLLLFAINEI